MGVIDQAPAPPPWVAENLGFLLAKAGSVSAELFRRELAPLGIRPRHYSVLSVLLHTAEPCTQQMTAGCLELEPSSLVAVVDELEELDLIRRQRDPEDRRRNILVVTSHGRDVVTVARRAAQRVDDQLFGGLPPEPRVQLEAALTAVAGIKTGQLVDADYAPPASSAPPTS